MLKSASPFHFKMSLFSHLFVSLFLILAISSCACTDNRKSNTVNEQDTMNENHDEIAMLDTLNSTRSAPIEEAVAKIHPLEGSLVNGKVTFKRVSDGIKIIANVYGLSPGMHGFHVHEFGECSGNGTSAGGHFNPTHTKHGGPDSPERHVGDFGNLDADEKGYAHYERVDKIISFTGENSIIGRSIIIHANRDDYVTQPTGASGPRIACGVIEAISEKMSVD